MLRYGRFGSSNRVGARGFSLRNVQSTSGAHLAYSSTCTDVLPSLPGINLSELKSDRVFPSTAKFKNDGGHTSTPPYALMPRMRKTTFFVRRFREGLDLLVQWYHWWNEQQLVPVLYWAQIRIKVLRIGGRTPLICRLITGCRSVVILTVRFHLTSESVIHFPLAWESGCRVGPDDCHDGSFFPAGRRTPKSTSSYPQLFIVLNPIRNILKKIWGWRTSDTVSWHSYWDWVNSREFLCGSRQYIHQNGI
jgi:hypothetical protein